MKPLRYIEQYDWTSFGIGLRTGGEFSNDIEWHCIFLISVCVRENSYPLRAKISSDHKRFEENNKKKKYCNYWPGSSMAMNLGT